MAGTLAGLLGVGGGLVIVPVMLEILTWRGMGQDAALLVATGTSLAVIVPTAISSSTAHHRRGNVDTALLRNWVPPLAAAVCLGAWLAPQVPAEHLLLFFGLFVLTVAIKRLRRPSAGPWRPALPAPWVQWTLAALIGFVCVLMGIGAGTLGVAAFTAFAVPVHRAVGTAAVLGLVIAVPGALLAALHSVPPGSPAYTIGHVNLPALAIIAPLAVAVAPLGVRLGARLPPERLQMVFAVFLLLVGLRMLSRLV